MHPFADGNKRAALLTARYVLDYNKYQFTAPNNTVEFITSIASSVDNSQDDIDILYILNPLLILGAWYRLFPHIAN